MDKYSDEELFVQGLYNEVDEELRDIYKEQKNNRDELLKEIADIMLTYTIINEVMNISKKNQTSLNNKILNILSSHAKIGSKNQTNIISKILRNTVNNTYKHYSYNKDFKDVLKVVDNNFKGKHFSERVWKNEQDVAKDLYKQIQDFTKGNISVNDIKKSIQNKYNNTAYEIKRLTQTEIARCHNEAFRRFCEETGVEKVKYNARLDTKTCKDCSHYDGRIYDFGKEPDLPRHPLCRCFYLVES